MSRTLTHNTFRIVSLYGIENHLIYNYLDVNGMWVVRPNPSAVEVGDLETLSKIYTAFNNVESVMKSVFVNAKPDPRWFYAH